MRLNTLLIFIAASCTLILAQQAGASGSGESFRATNAKWKAECGSCHVAYPVRLLPAESWKAIMSGLDKHFETDASLDAATVAEITAFLEKNSGRKKVDPVAKPQLRITETSWFKREHDEVAPATWKNPLVKSPANCAACHTQADRGDFNEHNLRVPK